MTNAARKGNEIEDRRPAPASRKEEVTAIRRMVLLARPVELRRVEDRTARTLAVVLEVVECSILRCRLLDLPMVQGDDTPSELALCTTPVLLLSI